MPTRSWTATFATNSNPMVIDGTYSSRQDSDPSTWSQNQQTDGKGICIVYALPGADDRGRGDHDTGNDHHRNEWRVRRPRRPAGRSPPRWRGCQIDFVSKVYAYVKPANPSLLAMYPKALEIVLVNNGLTTLEISKFEIFTHDAWAFTECGPVCDTSLPDHPA